MNKVISHLIKNIISLLFTIIGAEIIFYSTYRKFDLIASLVIAILIIMLYCIFQKVVDLGKKGPILYLIVAGIDLLVSSIAINIGSGKISFYSWLMGGGSLIDDNKGYVIGAIFLISFIFSSLSYYFSVNIIRIPIMIMIFFISMILYIKGTYKENSIVIIIFIFLLFFIFILKEKSERSNNEKLVNIKLKYFFSIGGMFVAIVLLIGLIIPKPNNLPRIPILDEIKNYVLGYVDSTENIAQQKGKFNPRLSNNRQVNNSTTRNSNRVLYSFKGENPVYLIDHNFDWYDGNTWINKNKNYLIGYSMNDMPKTSEVEQTLKSVDLSKNNMLAFNKIREADNDIEYYKYLDMRCEGIITKYLIHPSDTINCILDNNKRKNVYLNGFDILFRDNGGYFESNQMYRIKYSSDEPRENTKEDIIMKTFNRERYFKFIENSYIPNFYSIKRQQLNEIESNYTKLEENTSQRIYSLAQSLTKDEESVYGKAKKIEDYFRNGDFTYDLTLKDQSGEGDYIDFFIFEGKQGYCVQYATAMTILCRAAGIPARYSEGYLITEKDKVGNEYKVKESNGHAFVEVFIPGYGWKIFEPTPGLIDNEDSILSEEVEVENDKDYKIIITVLIFATIIAVLSMVILLLIKVTKRPRFLKGVLKLSNEQALEELIKDCVRLLDENLGLTPYSGETAMKFASRVENTLNVGFKDIMKSYYEYRYSEKPVDKEIVEKALKVNKMIFEFSNK